MTVGRFTSAAGRARYLTAYDAAMAELPVPDRVDDVETSYGTVRTYRFGATTPRHDAEPPLVLLPGKGSPAAMWGSNLAGLLAIRSAVAVDLLGEPGLSVQTRGITGSADQARWLGEALDGLGLETAHLVGVSFGGWHAVNLARHRPELIASMTLLDPANTFGRIGPKVILFSLGAAIPGMPAWIRDLSLRWIAGGARAQDSAVGRLIAAGMAEYRSAVPVPQYPTDAQLRAITAPTAVVIAGRSIIHNPTKAAARARLVPDAGVELWPDASHALNGEFPDRVAAVVANLVGAAQHENG